MPLNPNAHLTSLFSKIVHHNLATPTTNYKNKWEGDKPMDGYDVVGVVAILYQRFGVIINIVCKEDNCYYVTIGNTPQCTCMDFIKLSSMVLGKQGKWMYCKHLYYEFIFLSKVNYNNDKFISIPTYAYNELMRLLELVNVVELK